MMEKDGEGWSGQSEDSRRCASGREVWDVKRSAGWNQEEENPFRHKAGIRRFRELYTGKRRKDRTVWSDYFVSGDFLEGYREGRFAELLLETVREYQGAFPPCREFLTELSIAYGVQTVKTGDGLQLRVENSAFFHGMDYIYEIMQAGASAIRFKGNDPAMLAGFRDYRELLTLAMSDWDDDTMLRLGKLLDHYTLSNLSDRPIGNAEQYELSWRHPKSLKLVTYFFTSQDLPEKVLQMPWDHLRLENATLGKEKLFYGPLREAVLARLPELGEKPRVSYKELLREFYAYGTGTGYYCNEGRTPEERKRLDDFLEQEKVQAAMNDAAFVEEQILHYWIIKSSGRYFLKRIREYYAAHTEAPFAERVVRQVDEVTGYAQIEVELREDEQSEPVRGAFDLQRRAYVRYYLNTAFHLAHGMQNDILLQEYLRERMPGSAEWGRKLTDPERGGFSSDTPVKIWFGKDELQVFFHPRHLEYRWNGSPLVPRYPGEKLPGIEDETIFWLLAPIAAASHDHSREICAEIMRRLGALPVHKEDIPVIADCITGWICRFDEQITPLCSLYAEKEAQLFGCDIYEDLMLKVYEETAGGKRYLPNGSAAAPDLAAALQMGQRFLEELVMDRPAADTGSMQLLPEQVLVKGVWKAPQTLAKQEVTEEAVNGILSMFSTGGLERMELAWSGHSLLFIKSGQQYGCFWFRHSTQDWYALVSLPEVYQVVESDDVVYEPFGLGMLPNYLIHPNPNRILQQIDDIMAQIARKDPCPRSMMWSPQIYRFETRQRYRLAKRQFGGYPAEQAQNQIQDRFYIPKLPVHVSYTDLEGTASGKKAVLKNKARLQQVLQDYMAGRLSQLVLVWHYEEGRAYEGVRIQKRCMVLMQDRGSHVMVWLEDDGKGMEYLVSDVNEYLDAEGKKYRKVSFRGRTMPGYRVHTDMRRIRDCLDLLIPQMQYRIVNKGGFGEFSYENKTEYEKIKAELDRMDREEDTPL